MNWKLYYSLFQHARNMGWRYVLFRIWYEFQRRTGLLKRRFSTNSKPLNFVSLEDWKNQEVSYFFDRIELDQMAERSDVMDLKTLKKKVDGIYQDEFIFFSSVSYKVSDWHTNPQTGYKYDPLQHWTQIKDFSGVAGDIKFIWEKSRFTFLYDLVRYDFHFKEDQAEKVFQLIENWIELNPENCGPNWLCSQEIALRILNWTFALHYFKASKFLSEDIFQRITKSIYLQVKHIEENLDFSRIAVRNNHILTESLALFLVGVLYPFYPESSRWKDKGSKMFEEEVAFQIEREGTYLQFSMNYQRVAVQLLSWAIRLAELNGHNWSRTIYQRANASVDFLVSCQDQNTGWLPNYGNNDGSLFFPLSDCHYRDFRPQLTALSEILGLETDSGDGSWNEETGWYFGFNDKKARQSNTPRSIQKISSFERGGYFFARDDETMTFLKCGSYFHRPFQADNNHLDIWVKGENILRDAGSYIYNTDEKWLSYFSGTASHNTVMIGNYDQMEKGPRFIWQNWIKCASGSCSIKAGEIVLNGEFTGFKQLGENIKHRRKVRKPCGVAHWTIEDWLENVPPDLPIHQIWHPSGSFYKNYVIRAFEENGFEIVPNISIGWYSESYGIKNEVERLIFSTNGNYIKTIISAKTSL